MSAPLMLRNTAIALVVLLHAAAGPVASVVPAIAGPLQQGKQLTVSTGTWGGSGTVVYAYQWYRCDATGAHCGSIHGATRASYTQVAKDVGGTVTAAVAATDATGTTRAFASLAGLVAPKSATLIATAQPAVTGQATVGQVVAVSPVKWSAKTAAPTYAWQRCDANGRLCVPIDGATGSSYTVDVADVGSTLLAEVTGTQQTVLSLPTGVVAAASGPTMAGRPSVTGTLQQGQKVTGRPGTWVGSGAIAYAYQWYRCDESAGHCHAVHGATKASYVEVAKDVGQTLGLTVRATDSTGTATAYAPVAGTVAATGALASTTRPTLTGKPAVGEKLAVKAGTWSAKPGALTYAWLRCNPNGRACTRIADAAGSSYVVTADDRGHEVVATVHAAAGTTVLTAASLVVV